MSSKAEKLLESMKVSQNNWKTRDILSLYEGFGFIITHGKSHDIVKHPDHPEIRTTIPRHNEIAKYYIKEAIELVEKVKK
jgi:predicted RNA binding protein YcfA (HicA-like mRNA interferase family)